jgi:hypothetical protein
MGATAVGVLRCGCRCCGCRYRRCCRLRYRCCRRRGGRDGGGDS